MNEWSENIVRLSDIRQRKSNALSVFGPVNRGLTTSQIIHDPQLTGLLNDLERKVEILQSRSFTVLDTLTIATEAARVALSAGGTSAAGISYGGENEEING